MRQESGNILLSGTGHLTILIDVEASILSASISKMFQLCMTTDLEDIPVTVLYKISVSKGNVFKQAKSMLTSGMFFIISGVC